MGEVKKITSLQNPIIKKILLLKEKSRERKKTGLFILEGQRELTLACKSDFNILTLFFYKDIISLDEIEKQTRELSHKIEFIEISKEVYQKIAYRQTTEGVLAIVKSKSHELSKITFKNKNPLILVAEAPEKPGNLGALLRTADAADLDAVLLANLKGDLYNPNTIRSSIGCVFTTTIATGTTTEIIAFLKSKNINIFCAALTASQDYTKEDYTTPTAIVVGTEATGLSAEWLEHSYQNIQIPMQGEIDSMNVSVAAAVLIFEAVRQRSVV